MCNLCYVLGGCNGMPREEELILLLVVYYYFLFTSESRSAVHKAIVIHNKHSLAALYCSRFVFLFFFFVYQMTLLLFSFSRTHSWASESDWNL